MSETDAPPSTPANGASNGSASANGAGNGAASASANGAGNGAGNGQASASGMPDGTPVIECRDLEISYSTRAGDIPAVSGFNMVLHRGMTIGLVGESGCGKSTMAMAIMRYLGRNGFVSSGQILYKGEDMASFSEEKMRHLRGNEIAMVYQEPMASLNPSLTLGRQLEEVLLTHDSSMTRAKAQERSLEMLNDVRLPDPRRVMAAYPHQISGGQQQRVVIAMALLSRPSVLLLDEPTTALDVTVEAGIVDLISELARRFDTALVYISHNLGLILETCDRVNVMYSGEVVENGAVGDVFRQMRHPYTRGLFGCCPSPARDRKERPLAPIAGQLPLPNERPKGCCFGPRCHHFRPGLCDAGPIAMETADEESWHRVRCTRWRELDKDPPPEPPAPPPEAEAGERILKVESLRKYYEVPNTSLKAFLARKRRRSVKANESLTLDAKEAETLAIVGESGCGKSTFAKVLLGLEEADGGDAVLLGDDVARSPAAKRSAEQISRLQMVFQNPFDTLNPSHTVGAQLGRVVRKFGVAKGRGDVRSKVMEMLDLVKLPREFADRLPRQLSGGQKQRVGIARAFVSEPRAVVADEPVSALDASVAAAVVQLLGEIQHRSRTTMLLISHDIHLVRYVADRVTVMYLGYVVERGDGGAGLCSALSPLHRGPALGGASARPGLGQERDRVGGRAALASQPALGLPVPHALPAQARRDLRDRDAARDRLRRRPQAALPHPARRAPRARPRLRYPPERSGRGGRGEGVSGGGRGGLSGGVSGWLEQRPRQRRQARL